MSPDALRAFFRMGVWVTIVALILVVTVPRESAEFVVSICSLGVGVALISVVLLVQRLLR
ncbi:MAG: hypothetical protein CL610_05115 [Anaerolineaceae bacterium]|nr:hypothetical protein [Anaerolineaceae bacterium]